MKDIVSHILNAQEKKKVLQIHFVLKKTCSFLVEMDIGEVSACELLGSVESRET